MLIFVGPGPDSSERALSLTGLGWTLLNIFLFFTEFLLEAS